MQIGQRVVCIDTYSPVIRGPKKYLAGLQQGAEYTISATKIDGPTGMPAVQVAELHMDEWDWFQAKRFRPILQRKTDISIFQKILRDVSKRRELVQ